MLSFLVPLLLLLQSCGGGGGSFTAEFAPDLSVTPDDTIGAAPFKVTFTIKVSDRDGTVIKVEADFDGDGTFEADVTGQATADFTFTTRGSFPVQFRATDNDGLTTTKLISITVADIIRTLTFPLGITTVKDIAFEPSGLTFWVLGSDGTPQMSLVRMNAQTGEVVNIIQLTDPGITPITLGEFAFDGQFFWITTGLPTPRILKLNTTGSIVLQIPCPSTASGVCRGVAFDGTFLWTGASDTRNLVQFPISGGVQKTLESPDPLPGVEDVGFDRAGNLLLVRPTSIPEIFRLNPTDGSVVDSVPVGGLTKGDWDGNLFWFVDDLNQEFKGLFLG